MTLKTNNITLSILLGCIPLSYAQAATDCAVQTDMPKTECEALLALYHSTDGENWTDSPANNWNVTNSPCDWTGVTCSNIGVIILDRNNQNLTGTIPAELGNLSQLRTLGLSNNQLTGQIPPELGNLSKLRILSSANNQLSGTIPSEFGNLKALKALNLSNNQLIAPVPAELDNLTELEILELSGNPLSTDTPAEEPKEPEAPEPSTEPTVQEKPSEPEIPALPIETPEEKLPKPPTADVSPIFVSPPFLPLSELVCGSNDKIIEKVCNYHGQTLSNIEVKKYGTISNLTLVGDNNNAGWISNVTLSQGATLTGGTLTGFVTNHGTITDVYFRGAELTGGTLAGTIKTKGVIKDVELAPNTRIVGVGSRGKLTGEIIGLENAIVENIVLEENSKSK